MIRRAVVLPAPDGPSRLTICGLFLWSSMVSDRYLSGKNELPSFMGNSLDTLSTLSRVPSDSSLSMGPGRQVSFSLMLRPLRDQAVGEEQSPDKREEQIFKHRDDTDDHQ